jgi:uncharacterized membrane protein
MILKTLLLLTLIAYSMIVSQSFMYILALRKASLGLDAGGYIRLRKLIDEAMRASFKYVIYSALILCLALTLMSARQPGSLLFTTAVIAFAALITDVIITLKGNMPINDIINSWSPDSYPTDWSAHRTRWLAFFGYRQVVNILGFLSLLVGAVFGNG